MKKKIILTKNRKKAIETALYIDDLLYERHRRWEKSLHADIEKWNRQKQVIEVRQYKKQKSGQHIIYKLQIIRETKTPQGIIVDVE